MVRSAQGAWSMKIFWSQWQLRSAREAVEPDCLEITCFESSWKALREALFLTFESMAWTNLDVLEIFLPMHHVLGTSPGLHFLFKSYFSLWKIVIKKKTE